ncbi:MAG: GHKL domain-containing protein [Clostridia bacterium]
MIGMKVVVDLFSSIIELTYMITFYSIFGERKEMPKYKFLLLASFYILINVLSVTFVNNQIIFVLINLSLILLCSILFKITALKRVLCCVSLYLVSVLGEILFGTLISAINDMTIDQLKGNVIIYLQTVLTSKITVYAIVRIVKHFVKHKNIEVSNLTLVPFIVLPITSFSVLYLLADYVNKYDSQKIKILVFVSALFLLLSNLLVFFIYDYVLKEKEKRQQIEKQALLLSLEKEYQIELTNRQIEASKTMHDLKNKLYAIKDLLTTNVEGAMSEINKICDIVEKTKNIKITGVECIDALLSAKINEAKKYNITTNTNVAFASLKVDIIDLCVIIGNLFDNCIDAVKKISFSCERIIDIDIKQNQNFLSVLLSNPAESVSDDFDELETTKKDKLNHGYGLKNVKTLVKKYNGEIKYGKNGEKFVVNVILEN